LNFLRKTPYTKRITHFMDFLEVRADTLKLGTRYLYVGPFDFDYWTDEQTDHFINRINMGHVYFVQYGMYTSGAVVAESPFIRTSTLSHPKWTYLRHKDLRSGCVPGDFRIGTVLDEGTHFFRWSEM
jgi:hypothetical protein